MRSEPEYVSLSKNEIIKVTLKALRILFHEQNKLEVWIPRSVCHDGDSLNIGDTDVMVEEWFTIKEGLE